LPGHALQRLLHGDQPRFLRSLGMLMRPLPFSHSGEHHFGLGCRFTLKLIRMLGDEGLDGAANASFPTALLAFNLPQILVDRQTPKISRREFWLTPGSPVHLIWRLRNAECLPWLATYCCNIHSNGANGDTEQSCNQ
jgi:hypothetical protein